MTNLHMALIDRMGVHVESLGDSNGERRISFGLDVILTRADLT